MAAYSADSPGNTIPNAGTCDELAQVISANGLIFAEREKTRYCPSGSDLESPPIPGGLPARLCICKDGLTGQFLKHNCAVTPPPECRRSPWTDPYAGLYAFPILEVQSDLYVVASTINGVEVVSGENLPTEGPVDTGAGGPPPP